jgi:hypothetical protein
VDVTLAAIVLFLFHSTGENEYEGIDQGDGMRRWESSGLLKGSLIRLTMALASGVFACVKAAFSGLFSLPVRTR